MRPSKVSPFAYDNHRSAVESFLVLSPDMHPVAEDSLGGLLDEVESEESESDEEKVADPGVEASQMQTIEHMRVVDHVPHVEVQQVKAIAGFPNKDKWGQTEELRQWIDAGKADHNATE